MKKITSEHWQAIMKKLEAKGMKTDAAYAWMEQRFECEEDNQMPDKLHTTNIDADTITPFWRQKR